MSIREWWRRTTTPSESTERVAVATSGVELDEAPPTLEQQATATSPGGGMAGRRPAPRHKATRNR